ncbi:MAG: tRNA (guanosine(37)-N1)-methyltransferase TrmD [Lachnospiraceae bacterium]|nr:tRNA (guanosine(37)-N1)-methyltransferase TrmD [Lachnospiraceae bacterium]
MNFHVMTLFPEMVESVARTSILGRAEKNGLISVEAVNIRDYTDDPHRKVDDYPYGGGPGMVMQAQPVYDCYRAIRDRCPKGTKTVFMTAQGKTFNQELAGYYAGFSDVIILCGHYEGIDERVIEEIGPDEISIGDFVLTGGELPALCFIDTVSRLVPGVLHNADSAGDESFQGNLLEYPQYSRPEEWMGRKVPDIILSGDHAAVERYRKEEAEKRTAERRPDMYEKYLAQKPPEPKKRRRHKKPKPGAGPGEENF